MRGRAQGRWWAGASSTMRGQVRGERARCWVRSRRARETEPGQARREEGVRWESRARKRQQAEVPAQPRSSTSLGPQRGMRRRQARPPASFREEATSRRSALGKGGGGCCLHGGAGYLKFWTEKWEEKRRKKLSWPVREKRNMRRMPRPTGASTDFL